MKLLTLALSIPFAASAASITVGFNQPGFAFWPAPLSPADAQPVFGTPAQASVNFQTLPRFNSSLGTPTSVDYSITSLYTFDDTIHNGTGSDIDVQVATGDISTWRRRC